MKEADIFPIEVDLTLLTLRGIEDDNAEDDEEEDEQANGGDLLHDDQDERMFNQRQTVQDADLLNIGQ